MMGKRRAVDTVNALEIFKKIYLKCCMKVHFTQNFEEIFENLGLKNSKIFY